MLKRISSLVTLILLGLALTHLMLDQTKFAASFHSAPKNNYPAIRG
jgi:hypothetical protein